MVPNQTRVPEKLHPLRGQTSLDILWPAICHHREHHHSGNKGLSRNDVTLGLLNKADTPPPPDHFSSLFG